jgi:ketosteroid isomerase-like protein
VARGRIEWAERMVELWNAGDLDAFLDEIGPEFQFTPDPTFPDTGVYEGDALRKWMREWARIWENNRFEILDFSEHGDAALIRSRWHLGAPRSGEEVPVQDFTVVLWWEGPEAARPSRMAAFFDHEQALRAAAGGTG